MAKAKNAGLCILGTQTTGLCLALLASDNKQPLLIWTPDKSVLAAFNKGRKLPAPFADMKAPDEISLTDDLQEAVHGRELVILSTPSYEIKKLICTAGPALSGEQILIHGVRGIETEDGEVVPTSSAIRQNSCIKKVGVISGPMLADDIRKKNPASAVVASPFAQAIKTAARYFNTSHFQLFSNRDMLGVEIAAALKDIYAMAWGMGEGLGFTAGSKALVLTRGLAEMSRFGAAFGADPATFFGLAGMGNLLASVEPGEPAYVLGKALAQKQAGDIPEDDQIRHTIEEAWKAASRWNIPMPILAGVRSVLSGKWTAATMAKRLIAIEAGGERDLSFSGEIMRLPIPVYGPKGGRGKS